MILNKASDVVIAGDYSIRDIISQELTIPHFQSIVDFTTEKVHGFESLVRSGPDIPFTTPDQLFFKAQTEAYLWEFDQFCARQALDFFVSQKLSGLIFINILPINLSHLCELHKNSEKKLPLENVVLEISEKYPLNNVDELKESIRVLRNLGALFAIDDLGAGYSGLKTWAEIRPNFVKIDRHFIDNINRDSVKREFVRSIMEIARGLKCQVIAEGIENIQQLEVLTSIGIKYGQGYFLHRPEANPQSIKLPKLSEGERSVSIRTINASTTDTAQSILEKVKSIDSSTRADVVNDLFKQDKDIRSVPIVDDNKPIGIITRGQVLEIFSGRYSHQLHGNKAIAKFMNPSPVIVDLYTSLQEVSKKVTLHAADDLNTDFIITENGDYVGVGKVASLLEHITDFQIRYARYSNPLTMLPGNVPIYEWIDDLLKQSQDFWLAYFDINHFKPFNDYYGYSRGDEVISKLADIIVDNTSPNMDMVGHVGGDDFVVIFRSLDWEQRCQQILYDFESSAAKFYSPKELAEKGIWCENRQGKLAFFNLLSLAIGAVNPDPRSCQSHHEIAALATDAKHKAKLEGGNHLFVCRRRGMTLSRFSHKQNTNRSSSPEQ